MSSTRESELCPPTEVDAAPLSRLEHSLVRMWRTAGLNRILNRTVTFLPRSMQNSLARKRSRVQRVELLDRVRNRPRLVPEEDLQSLLTRGLRLLAQRYGADSIGAYLEFGVYNGTSLVCTHRALEAMGLHHVRLIGFDSFQGFPSTAAIEDGGRWQPGRCHSTQEFTSAVLHYEGVDPARVTLVPGWFSETLNEQTARRLQIDKASVIMIDCDLYSSTRDALEFCAPLIQDEALILFDEWSPRSLEGKNMGERRAFAEFLRRHRCFAAIPFGKYASRTETFLVSRRRT